MEKSKKVIYYDDELNNEFSGANIKPRVIGLNYKYISRNPFYNFFSFIAYRLIATPIAFVYKWMKGIKFVNTKVLRQYKKQGCFIFGNHTNAASDVLSPHVMTFPTKTYVIVASENMNIPGLWGATKMLGALPLPTTLGVTRNFMNAIEKRLVQGHPILIYPEAHIWPYYTGIRPFKSTAFRYPIKFEAPSFCLTTTYQQRGKRKKPRIVIYVDGPFYPNQNLDIKQQQEDLRNQIYTCMVERSKNSNCKFIEYIKKEKK